MSAEKYPRVVGEDKKMVQFKEGGVWWGMPDQRTARLCAHAARMEALLEKWWRDVPVEDTYYPLCDETEALLADVRGEGE